MHVNIVIHKFVHYIISFRAGGNVYWFHRFRADGEGPAAPVLAVWHAVCNKNTLILRNPPNLQGLLLSLRGLLVAYKDSS